MSTRVRYHWACPRCGHKVAKHGAATARDYAREHFWRKHGERIEVKALVRTDGSAANAAAELAARARVAVEEGFAEAVQAGMRIKDRVRLVDAQGREHEVKPDEDDLSPRAVADHYDRMWRERVRREALGG